MRYWMCAWLPAIVVPASITSAAELAASGDGDCEQTDNCEDTHCNANSRAGGMRLRRRTHRNRFSGALGLARSFRRQSTRAWRGLRDLRGQLAKSFPRNGRNDEDQALQGSDCGDRP